MSEHVFHFVEHARAGLVIKPAAQPLANTFLRSCGQCHEMTPHYPHETFVECAICRKRTFKARQALSEIGTTG